MKKDIADQIVDAIFKDLRGRKMLNHTFNEPDPDTGRQHAFGGLEKDVQDEIKSTWAKLIRRKLKLRPAKGNQNG